MVGEQLFEQGMTHYVIAGGRDLGSEPIGKHRDQRYAQFFP